MGIRLLVIDDNPHLAWRGGVHPANATFEQFVAGLLDLPGSPVEAITAFVPLRDAHEAPASGPLDPRIVVVGGRAFDGIAGYLRHLPTLLRANRAILRRAMADGDLVWIKVPASNAALAAALATRAGVPRFVWVAGSAGDVAAGRYHGPSALVGRSIGAGYDLVGRLAGVGGRRLVVGDGIADGDGVVASLVEPWEVRVLAGPRRMPGADRTRLAWAGRLVAGKGLEALIGALALDQGPVLDVLGSGPDGDRLQRLAESSDVSGRVTWLGHVADRSAYLDRLAAADAFVFPSPAEGFPKVVLDALAVGLPVVATRAGALTELARADLLVPIEQSTPGAIVAALGRMRDEDAGEVEDRRQRGLAFAARHTRPAEAARLVALWRRWWPDLPWDR